jgi:ferredoxin-NADP reductase
MAMLRLARKLGRPELVRLVVSVRSPADLYYAAELPGPESSVVFTRSTPPGSTRPPGRLSATDVEPAMLPGATAYICGSAAFADAASALLLASGMSEGEIRVERFGPSG